MSNFLFIPTSERQQETKIAKGSFNKKTTYEKFL